MATTAKKFAVIVGSTRPIRVGPSISQLVQKTIQDGNPGVNVELVDVAAAKLPLFDEPTIPMRAKKPEDYVQEHTRNWSRLIGSYSGFVFVTPQYNWSIPAGLKNCIDYLFNEWTQKPAVIVSYGGHGGDKAASALLAITKGMRMDAAEETVQLDLSKLDNGIVLGSTKGQLASDAEEKWAADLTKLQGLFSDLVKKAEAQPAEKSSA